MASLLTKIEASPESKIAFANWQAQLHQAVVGLPGFLSLDITSATYNHALVWTLVQRFDTPAHLSQWRSSPTYQHLSDELGKLFEDLPPSSIQEKESEDSQLEGGITEVFITEVSKEKEEEYRQWIAKMHAVEARFPGFKGVYVQSPGPSQGRNWITLLQFDTVENLDRWLFSSERQQVLNESKPLIASLESHRVASPYGGWFQSLAQAGEVPPVWKQTMIVLLVLFPIVMLELKYLTLLTGNLNPSLGTFIGNAISVALIAWPVMPVAIWFLGWWLSPYGEKQREKTILGTGFIFALYLLEILLFWHLL